MEGSDKVDPLMGFPFKTPFCSIGIPNQGIYLLHLPGDLDTGKMEPL